MTAPVFRHGYYGWSLEAPFRIESLPILDDDGAEADIILREGALPAEFADPVWSTPFISFGADGQVLVTVQASGRFLVSEGREITIDRMPEIPDRDIGTLLTSAVAGVVLHQRNMLALHASCVEIGGKIFAFAGPAGRGKSTLARALVQRGARLHSDDIAVIRFAADGTPMVPQGTLSSRLWPDSLREVGADDSSWAVAREGTPKKMLIANDLSQEALPLAAVIRLETTHLESPTLTLLSGPQAVMPISSIVYRHFLGRQMGRAGPIFKGVMRMSNSVPVFELARLRNLDSLDKLAEMVLDFARQRQ